jgi:hypothetical protein
MRWDFGSSDGTVNNISIAARSLRSGSRYSGPISRYQIRAGARRKTTRKVPHGIDGTVRTAFAAVAVSI